MADRNLSTTEEKRRPEGPYWRLKIDRSASGQPGLFFTIETQAFPEEMRHVESLNHEMTFIAEDAWAALAAPLAWLITDEFRAEVVDQVLQASMIGTRWQDFSPELRQVVEGQVEATLAALVAVAQKRAVSE